MKNPKNNLFIALACFVAGMGLLSSCGPNQKEKDEQAQTVAQENALDTPTVTLIPVAKGKLASNITVPGELQPFLQVDFYQHQQHFHDRSPIEKLMLKRHK